METKNIKITTRAQFAKLVQLMEDNPDIGRGKPSFGTSKHLLKDKWEQFSLELNSLGPPSRTGSEWQRVWIHYKSKVKKKVAANRQNILATGGGPSEEVHLNPLEESVTQLVQMTRQINPSGRAFGIENVEPIVLPAESPKEAASLTAEAATVEPPTPHRRRTRRAPEDERLELLRTQVQTQKEILKTMAKIENTAYKNYTIKKELLQLEKNKAKEKSELNNLKMECQRMKIAKLFFVCFLLLP